MKQKKFKILIVEDDVALLKMLSRKLEFEHFEVIEAINGQQGLDKSISQSPDLIILDILMPVMDGLLMLQKLRETNDYGKKVPVVILTNLSAGSEDIIKKVAETKPVYYFVKVDMTIDSLIKKIKELLH